MIDQTFIHGILSGLKDAGVCAVQWKSTVRLESSYRAETDFDLFVGADMEKTISYFLSKGAVHVQEHPAKAYPGMEHLLLFDVEGWRLYHIHLYAELRTGSQKHKAYVFSFDSVLKEGMQPVGPLYVPAPELEWMTHLLRTVLKFSLKNALKNKVRILFKKKAWYPGLKERLALKKHTCRKDVETLLNGFPKWKPYRSTILSLFDSDEELRLRDVFRLRVLLKEYRRYTYASQLLRRVQRAFLPRHASKKLPGVGAAVAVIGIDGAGKTTLLEDIRVLLQKKMWVEHIYMGAAVKRGMLSPWLRILLLFSRFFRKCSHVFKWGTGSVYSQWLISYMNASVRLAQYKKGMQALRSGALVLFERFPLDGVADHPTFWGWNKEKQGQHPHLYAVLERMYARISPPSALIVLSVEEKEVQKRKAGLQSTLLKKKATALNSLSVAHTQIDAGQPYREVRTHLATFIWEILLS